MVDVLKVFYLMNRGAWPSELESYHYEEILVLTHLKYYNKGMICKLTVSLPYPQATPQASTEHHELATRVEALQRGWMQRQRTSARNAALPHQRSRGPAFSLQSWEEFCDWVRATYIIQDNLSTLGINFTHFEKLLLLSILTYSQLLGVKSVEISGSPLIHWPQFA